MVETVNVQEIGDRTGWLERRIREVEDRDAIYRLFVDLQDAMDSRDLERYGSLYTEDGEWCAISGRAIGPVAITAFLQERCKPWKNDAERTYHSISDVSIELDADTATAWGQWQHNHPGENGQPVMHHFGHFEAVLQRTQAGWRIKRRASYGDLPYSEPKFQLVGLVEEEARRSRQVVSHIQSGVPSLERRHKMPRTDDTVVSNAPGQAHGGIGKMLALEARLADLEARVKEAEDRDAIYMLFLKLQNATDTRDAVKYGQCFTKDGEWSGISGRAVGREAITEYMGRFYEPRRSEAERTFHSISDLAIDLDGDTAKARAQYRHIKLGEGGKPVAFHFGYFDAALQRTTEGWRFKRRAGYVLLPYIKPKFQSIADPET